MALLTRSQRVFGSELARLTGLDTRLVGSWLLNEQSSGAARARERAGNNNWLNIGYTDSGQRGTGAGFWQDPVKAAEVSARWLRGEFSVPGFGRAAPGIVSFSRTAGKGLDAQVRALQQSGWASSGYPDLPKLVQQYGGRYGLSATNTGQARNGALAGGSTTVAGRPQVTTSGGDDGSALLGLLQQRLQGRQQGAQVPSAGLSMPAFAAGPRLPAGYQSLLGGGGSPARAGGLADTLAQIASLQGAESTVTPTSITTASAGRVGRRGRPVPSAEAVPVAAALRFARNRIGVSETTGANRGPLIDRWQQSFGMSGEAWCGIFVGKALQRAGVRVDPRIASTAAIYDMAKAGTGGFRGLVSAREVRPGDVVVWDPGPNGHTGIVERVLGNGQIVTIEGNTSDQVGRRTHPSANAFFARPAYPVGQRRRAA